MSQWVVITGVNSGIGLAAARAVIADGRYSLICTARPGRSIGLPANQYVRVDLDLADDRSIELAADQIMDVCGGKLYGLFNNAGYGLQMAVEDVPMASLKAQVQVNTFGPVHLTKLLLPALMKSTGAKIVFNSSVLGFLSLPFRGPYCASKYALEALADAMRLELAGAGVSVVLFESGPVIAKFKERAKALLEEHSHQILESRLDYSDLFARLSLENGAGRIRAEVIGTALIKILSSPNPSARYRFTTSAKIGYILRLLPTYVKDLLVTRAERIKVK